LVFVPGDSSLNGESHYTIEVSELLPEIHDSDTIVDGRARQVPTFGNRALGDPDNLNPDTFADPNPTNVNDFTGAVGVDSRILEDAEQAVILGLDAPDLEIVNTSGNFLSYGLSVRPNFADSTADRVLEGVEISNISIHGFGDTTFDSGNIVVNGRDRNGAQLEVTGLNISENVIGAAPDLESSSGPDGSMGSNVVILSASGIDENSPNEISNNLIVGAAIDGIRVNNTIGNVLIEGNVIRDNGNGPAPGDGIFLLDAFSISVVGNYISGNERYGIEATNGGGHLIRSNTITANGDESSDLGGGIRLRAESGSDIIGNSILGNFGGGVDVASEETAGVFTPRPASSQNLISRNEFADNDGIAIDLSEIVIDVPLLGIFGNDDGDGITLEEGQDDTTGNRGTDAPVIDNVTFANDQLVIEFAATGALADVDGVSGFDQANDFFEFYVARPGDDGGDTLDGESYGEGASFIGSVDATELVFENGKWTVTLDRPEFGWPDGGFSNTDSITAIAIDMDSNTSEFGRNAQINIAPVAVNEAPVVTNIEGTALAYTEDDGAVAVTETITFTDMDDANIEMAVVQITGAFNADQDTLTFTGQNGINGTFDSSNGRLELRGTATSKYHLHQF